MTFAWNETTIERAKSLFLSGIPASVIAKEIGAVSRSAVIGKMHRAGVTSPKPRNAEARIVKRQEAQPPKQAQLPSPSPVALVPDDLGGKTIIELTARECRFPLRETAGTHRFCAAPTAAGESYCPACRALVYDNRQRPFGHRLPVMRFR